MTPAPTPTLLPCPFCGCEDVKFRTEYTSSKVGWSDGLGSPGTLMHTYRYAVCQNQYGAQACAAKMGGGGWTEADCARAWNTRARPGVGVEPVIECPNCCAQNGDLECRNCGESYGAQDFVSPHYSHPPIPAPPAQGADTLNKLATDLLANQQRLPPDIEQIMHDRRADLYVDPPAQPAEPSGTEAAREVLLELDRMRNQEWFDDWVGLEERREDCYIQGYNDALDELRPTVSRHYRALTRPPSAQKEE